MPSESVHVGKGKSFIRSFNCLLQIEKPYALIDPLATLAYYAAMHCLEACFARGLGAPAGTHCRTHPERVNRVLRNKDTFGSKPANAFKTLYDFSRIARYSQDKPLTTPVASEAGRRRGPAHLGQDPHTLDEIVRRLGRCVEKVRTLLDVSQDALPNVGSTTNPKNARLGEFPRNS